MVQSVGRKGSGGFPFFVFEDNLNNKDNCFIGYRFVF